MAELAVKPAENPVEKEIILSVNNIEVVYDEVILVLRGISLDVPRGELVTLLGPNGAGKSTTLKAISGLLKTEDGEVTRGSITFNGESIANSAPDEIVRKGIFQVMEGRRIIEDMTVIENLRLGAFTRKDKFIKDDIDKVFHYFPRLKERRTQWARTLSGGEQQMVAIGRALMSKPRLLLLDEPSMGLSPVMVQEIAGIIVEIAERGVPVVLVEQNAELALRLAKFAYVLETGNVALEGPARELHESDHVRRAYLGG